MKGQNVQQIFWISYTTKQELMKKLEQKLAELKGDDQLIIHSK
jgi:hypothetical protein